MLDRDDIARLSHLSIGASFGAPALSASLRRARLQGLGLEFQEYRHYQPGDDPRLIDWTVEARLRQLVVRVARADGHLAVHTLVDASGSMAIGSPEKFASACRVAAALSFLAIERRDAAGVALFDDDVRQRLPPATGRGQLLRILDTMRRYRASGASNLTSALTRYGTGTRGPGLAVVISDFLTPTMDSAGWDFLIYRGLAPVAVQVLADDEVDPAFDDAEVVDAEHEDRPGVAVDRGAVAEYRQRFAAHQAALHTLCVARGIPFVSLRTSSGMEPVLRQLESIGLLCRVG